MEENFSINGILVVNKPVGLTSRDIVNKVSYVLKTKKVGHTGTLDPLATGVLVLTIGKCTKLSEFLMSKYKSYTVLMILGYETDTLDITGTTLKTSDIKVDENSIIKVIKSFIRKYNQEVPAYSAVKINGKKLYEYARSGEDIDLPSREVDIKDISNIEINDNEIKFSCVVSKGTYIRSLVRDIGKELGTFGTMKSLVRTSQGNYTLDDSYSLEDIENGNYTIIKLSDILKDIHTIDMDDELFKQVSNGGIQKVDLNEEYIAYRYNNEYVALYKKNDNNEFRMYVKF